MTDILFEILLHLAVAFGLAGLLAAALLFSYVVYLIAQDMRRTAPPSGEPIRFPPPAVATNRSGHYVPGVVSTATLERTVKTYRRVVWTRIGSVTLNPN